jgi:acyl-CoA synthetase (AMP-forming)/AMP-acid ligase II
MQRFLECLLPNHAERRTAVALIDENAGIHCTYQQLIDAIDGISGSFRRGDKSLVLLVLRNALDYVCVYLASIAAGHAVMIVDGAISGPQLLDYLEKYQPEWCFAPHETNAELSSTGLYESVAAGVRQGCLWRRRANTADGAIHRDLQLVLPTSGSTGNPKTVKLSELNITSNTADIVTTLSITEHDRAITSLPLYYVYGLSVLHSHLRAGASVVLTSRPIADPNFWRLVREFRCTSFSGVPLSYKILRQLQFWKVDDSRLSRMTQAGGKLDPEQVEYFREIMQARGGRFYVMYGQTEAAPRMTTLAHHDIPAKLGSVGKPLPSGRVSIRPAPQAEEGLGEICYAGPNVMMGYAEHCKDLAAGDEMQGVLATGDLGYLDSDGFVYVCGRLKRIAKVAGTRVNLDDVERVARSYGQSAAVEDAGKIVIYVTSSEPAERIGLLAAIRVYPNLLRVVQVPELPLLRSGKIDYQKLAGRAQPADRL